MNAAQTETELLLSRMAATRPLAEPAGFAAARRTRVVRALFDRHVRILERRSRVLKWQRRALWLAVAAMPVLAVTGGWYFRSLAMPTIAFVEKFRDEFEAHLDGKPCPFERPRRGASAG